MRKPTSPADGAPIRVVIVTMDSHLASAVARAEASLRRELPGLTLAIHAADEWGNDPHLLADCHADIARADIILCTMLFLEDHIQAVYAQLKARRDSCDAIVCCLSAAEIVRLTRAGRFNMSAESLGAISWLKRLRGSRTQGSNSPSSSGQGQMALLRQLPKLLRFVPGTAQDVRAYFLTLQYWLAGSEQNIANMVRLLVKRYAHNAKQLSRSLAPVADPIVYPDVGLYHPRATGPAKSRVTTRLTDVPAPKDAKGTVGLLILRSYVLSGNAGHYDGVIAALEAQGLRVVPAFASGLDARPAIESYFLPPNGVKIDALVSLSGFSLVGGPAYNDARAAEEMLAKLDVPYVGAHPVEFQTLEQWHGDDRGLTPIEATMMVAIPELDGAILPMTYGGRSSDGTGDNRRDMTVHDERAAMLAARVSRLVALRKRARAERKLGVVLFNFPPNSGATGTAAYLSVFASLFNILHALKAQGYTVELPASVDDLRRRILEGNAERHGTAANVAARIAVDAHVRRETWLSEIERQWGSAPGKHQSNGRELFVLGTHFGNVFVGIQPAFGYEGDPMRLLFERGFAPTHAFSAFYRWLREDYAADAVLHFGTHGALEFMPGKHAGLSGDCWPDRLIGDLPNFYLYASNNPSEGALAKRRAGATLVSYLPPQLVKAGLYRGLQDLKTSLEHWRTQAVDNGDTQRRSLLSLIQAQASAVELTAATPPWDPAEAEAHLAALGRALYEVETSLIPSGLHVIGAPPPRDVREALAAELGLTEEARDRVVALLGTDHETPALLHALDGGYIRPAPGGDLVRTLDVLPSGRNIHGFDPFKIPSTFAVRDGAAQADRLLARHKAEGRGLPRSVALVLWGTDNLKTEGGPIAQALWLLGAEPRHDSYGRVCGAKLIPLETLGRPRIDCVITLSGIFRDLLPLQTKLLAEAALLAASAKEPAHANFVRANAIAYMEKHGSTIEEAALRVFSNADGAYGSNVNHLVDQACWNNEDELAEAYVRRKSFAYGTDGRPGRHEAVLEHLLSRVDITYQNLDSIELGVTTVDHYFDTLGGVSRAVRQLSGREASVYIGDQTRGDGLVRTLSEQVTLETRTRALNPKWYEALLEHGYEGVRQIEAHVTNTLGWSATTGQVQPWLYQQLTETFILDDAMRERMTKLNPAACAKVANRLIEAHTRKYWSPDPAVLEALYRAGDEIEDRLENIKEHAVS